MKKEIISYSSVIARFVDIAIRYDFDLIKLTYGSEDYIFSIPLTPLIKDIEKGYSLFIDSVYEIENTRAIKNRFIPNIERYNFWYNKNQNEITKLFGEKNVYSIANETLQFTKNKIIDFSKEEYKKEEKNYKEQGWFKVGVLFASGEMDELLISFNNNATQIAKHKFKDKWKKYRPYISDSIAYDIPGTKNLFLKRSNLIKINDHCINNDISITPSFSDKFPSK
jgi:hypothetical protein